MKLFLFGLFIGVLALVSPLAVSAADTILVIGDSVAQGVAAAMKPAPTQTIAHQGDSARTIASKSVTGTFTHMVISAGSNLNPPATEADLRAIRAKQPNAKAVWILPYNTQAKATVSKVAASFGDSTVDLSNFPMAQDGYNAHPQSYSAVATAVKTALGSTAAPAQNAGGGANNAAGGGGTSGPQYNSAVGAPRKAGLVICALNHDDPDTAWDETAPCTACHVMLMGANVIRWIRSVMIVIGIAVIFAMGVLYVVSAGNDKMIGIAKGGIKAALIGITVILVAWLVISTIIRMMGASGFFDGYFQTGTFSFTCDTASNAGSATSTGFGAGGGGNGGSSNFSDVSGPTGNYTCTNGKCANMPDVVAAVKNNSSGIDPNILMAVIDGGEGCNKSRSSAGACGYSQVIDGPVPGSPNLTYNRSRICNIPGTPNQTCSTIQSNLQLDINCGAKVILANKSICGITDPRKVGACYNAGAGGFQKGACGQQNYCKRVEAYYNSCPK